jgi:hypothetical protein
MLRTTLSLVLSVSLTLFGAVPYTSAQASQTQDVIRSAVTTETMHVLTDLYNRCRSHNATAGDFQSAATALKILFAHWEETGLNAELQTAIASQAAALRGYSGPSDEQVNTLYQQLRSFGAVVTPGDARAALTVPQDQIATFLQKFNRPGGIKALESQVVSALMGASLIARNTSAFTHLASTKKLAPLQPVPDFNSTTCLALEAGALYLGVVGLACILCAGVPAVIGLGLAATALVGGC